MKLCAFDILSYGMAVVYAGLAGATVRQIASHYEVFQEEARAQSLRLYLYLTLLFASLRCVDFLLSPMLVPCTVHEWQWDQLGDKNILDVILSTLPAALFFASYSSFAYSTARVYDSLTRSTWTRATRCVLVFLNLAVFLALVTFWAVFQFRSRAASPFDRVAQVTLAASALATSSGFLLSFVLTLRFYRNEADGHRAEQVEHVVRMARIVVVSVICTACFAMRAVILLIQLHLAGASVILYFLVAEVVPTCSMLYTFSAKGRAPFSIRGFFGQSVSDSSGEYASLKTQAFPTDHYSGQTADYHDNDHSDSDPATAPRGNKWNDSPGPA